MQGGMQINTSTGGCLQWMASSLSLLHQTSMEVVKSLLNCVIPKFGVPLGMSSDKRPHGSWGS